MRLSPSSKSTNADLRLRLALASDATAINEIYNHYVLRSTCTYQDKPDLIESRQRWLANHDPARYPVVVAEQGKQLIGWGSLSPFHSRAAYQHTVEDSIYVHHEHQRRGVGSMLLRELISRGRAAGHHAMMALIDGEQSGSVALHARFGFEQVGYLKQVGFKFNRWLDVIYMELLL